MSSKAAELEIVDQPLATAPHIGMEDDDVENTAFDYSHRGPEDWVSSGPLGETPGRGRRFEHWDAAEAWAKDFFGARFKGPIVAAKIEGHGRWCFLIQGPRGSK